MAKVNVYGDGVLHCGLIPLTELTNNSFIEEVTERQLTIKIDPEYLNSNKDYYNSDEHQFVIYGNFTKDEELGGVDLTQSIVTGFEIQNSLGEPLIEYTNLLIKGTDILEIASRSPDRFASTNRTWDEDLVFKGNDTITGGSENDWIVASGGGTDLINCGDGEDNVYIKNSKARLTGGKGDDYFHFELWRKPRLGRSKSTASTITDFRAKGMGKDRIYIMADGVKEDYYARQVKVFTGAAGQYKFESGVIMLDTDGNKSADFFLNLQGSSTQKLSLESIIMSKPI